MTAESTRFRGYVGDDGSLVMPEAIAAIGWNPGDLIRLEVIGGRCELTRVKEPDSSLPTPD